MFGTSDNGSGTARALTMANQVSFEIVGQGNAQREEDGPSPMGNNPPQAGVRLLTAMPIVIMTLGSVSGSPINSAGFQLWNLTFMDTTSVGLTSSRIAGSALGGVDIINASVALIAQSDFEHFDKSGSYGMRAEKQGTGGTINNIFLLNDRGQDNSIWYDGNPAGAVEDGPIVVGGDIFADNFADNGQCFGIKSSGPIRIFGTHFDVGTGANGATPCFGVQAAGGQIYGKFEASGSGGTGRGNGVELTGSANGVEVNGVFNNEAAGVVLDTNAQNNRIVVLPGTVANTSDVTDSSNNTSNTIEIHGQALGANSFKFGGPLLPNAAASVDFGSITLPWKNLFLAGTSGTPATNNFEITGASTSGTRVITLPDLSATLVGQDTSGNVTLGTSTPSIVTSTNVNLLLAPGGTGGVRVPNGATATPALFMSNGPGFYSPSSGILDFQTGASTDKLAFLSAGLNAVSGVYGWTSSSTSPSGTADTGLSRDAAGVIDFGTGSSGSTAGSWKANTGTLGVATGTAPLVVTSTTPVANLTTVPTTYDHSGTQKTGTRIVADSGTLSGNVLTVTFTGAAIFGGAGNYFCTANDITGPSAIQIEYLSGSQAKFTGNGTHSFKYICIGN
jgi:hypothetical protein